MNSETRLRTRQFLHSGCHIGVCPWQDTDPSNQIGGETNIGPPNRIFLRLQDFQQSHSSMEPGDEKRPVTRAQIAAAEEAAHQAELTGEAGTAPPQLEEVPVAGNRPAHPQPDADDAPPADGARGGDSGAGENKPKQEPKLDGGTPLPGNDQAGQPRDAAVEADPLQVNRAAGPTRTAAGQEDDQQVERQQAAPLIDFQLVPAHTPVGWWDAPQPARRRFASTGEDGSTGCRSTTCRQPTARARSTWRRSGGCRSETRLRASSTSRRCRHTRPKVDGHTFEPVCWTVMGRRAAWRRFSPRERSTIRTAATQAVTDGDLRGRVCGSREMPPTC